MYTQSMIYNGNENPIYSHTLEEFINAGDVSSAPTFDTWCFAEKSNNIHYCVKNVHEYLHLRIVIGMIGMQNQGKLN